jgi:hypothetical protein
MTNLYRIEEYLGDKYDASVWTNGGTYHKVVIEDSINGGILEERKFYSRWKASHFAKWAAKGVWKKKEKPLTVKGHKPEYYRSGSEDTYWNCSCECGWFSKDWTTKKRDVVDSHQSHLSELHRNYAYHECKKDIPPNRD